MLDNNNNNNLNNDNNTNNGENSYREFSKDHSVEAPFKVNESPSDYYDFSKNNEGDFDFTDDFKNDFNSRDTFSTKKAKKSRFKIPSNPKRNKNIAIALGLVLMCATSGVAGGYATYSFMGSKASNNTTSTSSNYTQGAAVDNTTTPDNMSTNGTSGLTTAQIVENSEKAVVGLTTTSSQGESYGSGFIFNEDGYLLTNYHVVEGATQIQVTFSDGESATGKLINYDESLDLAVVQVQGDKTMPGILELGDSDTLKAGEPVVAIGNPLGTELQGTVTTGIISGLNRTISDGSSNSPSQNTPNSPSNGINPGNTPNNSEDTDSADTNVASYIQTDAAINPGNSGGPLLNSQGQVIGINSAKITNASSGTAAEGIGFAIPINTAKEKIQDLLKPIITLGLSLRTIDSQTAQMYNVDEGIYVVEVQAFSIAEKAGIKAEDYISKFDGEKISTADELNELKNKHESGDTVSVEVIRDGKKVDLTMTLK